MRMEIGDRRIRERGGGSSAYQDFGLRSRYPGTLDEQAVLVNVLIAALRQFIVVVLNMRRKRTVVSPGWVIFMCVNLGPRDPRDDDQGREYDSEITTGHGSATAHGPSLPQVCGST